MKKAINVRADIMLPFSVSATPDTDKAKELTKGSKASSDLGFGQVDVLVSNSGIDRHGESIRLQGIDITQFKRNPVILWGHEYESLPIGKSVKTWKEDGNLMARAELDWDIDEFALKIYKKILKGSINAVSIGGIVKEWNDDYTEIKSLEMIEFSFVPIGAHPDALVSGKSLQHSITRDQIQAIKDVLHVLESASSPEEDETVSIGLKK